ncbi:putative secreted RxLR effector protein [Phytophthora cinnamomi]|uniref:putative secreted RxLR effector protein n=1 Tax=Phytophthora cinnamomi TaxID=4785 RepID=UPI002A2B4831|nr:putative secreted RxLR effector protein [Phytophthora cinnamomi]KAJ8574638.1 hypothetical protein ON010_g4577 [Phytophthora cinnamomi]
MRLLCYVFLVLVVIFVADSHVASATDKTAHIPAAPVESQLSVAIYDRQRRNLRSDGVGGEDNEERGVVVVPSGVKEAAQKVKAKESHATHTLHVLNGYTPGLLGKVKRLYRKAKNNVEKYFRNNYWNIRFTLWLKMKRTPSTMYDKLKVYKTTGPYDKNYRVYINYLRFYETFKGPAYNPLIYFGPKFKID